MTKWEAEIGRAEGSLDYHFGYPACVGIWPSDFVRNSSFEFRHSISCRLLNEPQQIQIGLNRFELRELTPHDFWRAEEESDMGLYQHGGVVILVAGSNDVVVQIPERGDGSFLLIADAQPIVDDAVVDDLELVAEQGGPFQLPEER